MRLLSLLWTPWNSDPAVLKRLDTILTSWERTPYREHASTPYTRGINCIGFVCCVLDEWRDPDGNSKLVWPNGIPSDVGMNNPKKAKEMMRLLLETFPQHERVNDNTAQPGDILVMGQEGPGHAMIVGPRKNTIWHAAGHHVHYTGWELPHHCKHFATYRLKGRDTFI